MKKILVSLVMAVFALTALAQDSNWLEKAPQKYLPEMTQTIITRTSPCNQGDEAFMDFIPKFRTDKAFRNSRIKIDEDNAISKYSAEMFENWKIIKGGKGVDRREGLKYYGTWYNVSADEVCFQYSDEPTDPNAEWGGSGLMARFQRIGGKWCLTGLMIAG